MKKIFAILMTTILMLSAVASAEDFYPEDMKEYVNADPGYSILYPSDFTEETLTETPDGLQAVSVDGTRRFSVYCQENTEGWTNETWMAAKQAENVLYVAEYHELYDMVHLTLKNEATTEVTFCIVTEDWLYIAQMQWENSDEEFARFAVYMENSFTADEVSVG